MRSVRRAATEILSGTPVSDGAGVRLRRLIGGAERNLLDPFLLFDVFDSTAAQDYIAGFPPHPHRGFATFTWMLHGQMEHRDNAGNVGRIETDGAQWMHAGRGIVHSEMPQQDSGLLRGVQLWVNLPAAAKMTPPFYQDIAAADVPREIRGAGTTVRVLAGATSLGTAGAIAPDFTHPALLDITLAPGQTFTEAVAATRAALVWVADGAVQVNADRSSSGVAAGQLAVLDDSGAAVVELQNWGTEPARLLLASAERLHEPVARGGPFVMNTRAEITQAFVDYQAGALGGDYYIPGKAKGADTHG